VWTTNDLLAQPISLLINRDENGYADGSLLLDGGLKISEIESNNHEYYTILH